MLDGAGGLARVAEAGCEAGGTRDVLLAHRWLRAAREEDPRARLARIAGFSLRRRWLGILQRCAPVLEVPELSARAIRVAEAIAAMPAPELHRRARSRVTALLVWAGLDSAAARELMRTYEGFFPGVEVGVASGLHSRLGERGRRCLACLDLRSLTLDLVAGAMVWTVPEAGGGRWPAGVHLFSIGAQEADVGPRTRGRAVRAEPGWAIPHALPR